MVASVSHTLGLMRIATMILLLSWAWLAPAQGTFHFEWRGSQVHGGFDATWDEVHTPGTVWGSQLMMGSLSFTDFSGVVMNTATDDYIVNGGVNAYGGLQSFDITLMDWNRFVMLYAHGSGSDLSGLIQEETPPAEIFGTDWGYWSIDYHIPEPSACDLLLIGFFGWWATVKRR